MVGKGDMSLLEVGVRGWKRWYTVNKDRVEFLGKSAQCEHDNGGGIAW